MSERIGENIDWVGVLDWNIRDFHEFSTPRGVTYNAYLIRDTKTALIDTVKEAFLKELLFKISSLIAIEKLDYVVVNHAEPDHSSALPELMKIAKNAEVVCTKKCQEILSAYYDTSQWKFFIVKGKDQLSLGKKTLCFIETPMVHWPESMFTYLLEDKILFSMDAFGQHLVTSQRFDDQVDTCELMEEAKKYYANIIMPYGKQVEKVLEMVKDLEIKMIAPSHGVIWRKHLSIILTFYKNWASFRSKPKILVIYDSMWGSTAKMAEEIVRGASILGVEVQSIFIRTSDLTKIVSEVLDASTLVFGCSTLNMNVLPKMGELLIYLKGLKPRNKVAASFGSYGWGKGAPEALDEFIHSMGFEVVAPPIRAQWKPTVTVLQECFDLGKILSKKTMELE
ncbi:MAG: FprA family A-type flavoprotein [Chlamydiota bacterium]